ncbi:MAG: pheA [Verrucomicrobiaceae bacterium]|nr:pheA [Verrucomicrobiaceae bacterium]
MNLDEVRVKIDAIDGELLRLLNERAQLVNIVGKIKHAAGLEIYAPEREETLLRKLAALNTEQNGTLPEKSIRAIYREIMSAALALERQLKIAYLGPAGSWSHQVATGKFGHGVGYVAQPSIQGVFDCVASQAADYGVLPIEQAVEGVVHHTLDQLVDSPLQICAQIIISSGEGCPRSRFIILGRKASPATGDDSTMLMLEVQDQVGALVTLSQAFAKQEVNLRQIENRLVPQTSGEAARFFLEVTGHHDDAGLRAALDDLHSQGTKVKVLGSYPASTWVETMG